MADSKIDTYKNRANHVATYIHFSLPDEMNHYLHNIIDMVRENIQFTRCYFDNKHLNSKCNNRCCVVDDDEEEEVAESTQYNINNQVHTTNVVKVHLWFGNMANLISTHQPIIMITLFLTIHDIIVMYIQKGNMLLLTTSMIQPTMMRANRRVCAKWMTLHR